MHSLIKSKTIYTVSRFTKRDHHHQLHSIKEVKKKMSEKKLPYDFLPCELSLLCDLFIGLCSMKQEFGTVQIASPAMPNPNQISHQHAILQ